MKKTFLLLFLALTFSGVISAQNYPTSQWSDHADTSWYDSSQDQFSISTAQELAGLSVLVANGTTFENKTLNIVADIDLNAHLWVPIGLNFDIPFSGTVDGNGHSISNLWINSPDGDFLGLFGRCASATLSNINIDTAHILAGDTSGTLVGSFGTDGLIENCHVTNTSITGSSFNIGGLVGAVLDNSDIIKSSSSGNVTGVNQVGGLAGTAFKLTHITQCYSKGSVSGGYLIGGLVGYCTFAPMGGENTNNFLENSYSRASVSAGQGRAGGIYGGSDGTLRMNSCYSTGTVTAPEFAGGVIGAWGADIVIENTYFDTETSGQNDAVGGFTGPSVEYDIPGKTSAAMKTQEFVDSLNAGSSAAPWSIQANQNDGYPVLSGNLSTPDIDKPSKVVKLYPTRFDQRLYISSSLNLQSFKVYNLAGARVAQGRLNGTQVLNLGQLSTGIYIVKIKTAKNTLTKKVIKK